MKKIFLLAAFSIGTYLAAQDLQIQQADEVFEATLYPAAIDLYAALLKTELTSEEASHVRFRLGQAFFAQNDYAAVLATLEQEPLLPEADYLLGLTYRQLGHLPAAIAAFERYIQNPFPLHQEAHLELGIAYFLQAPFTKLARQHLEAVKLSPQKPSLYPLAQIYLARLELREGQTEMAEKRLRTLQTRISPGDLFYGQTSYWLGRILYHNQKYAEAAQTFAATLPKRLSPSAEEQTDILHYLVDCYLKLSEAQPGLYYDQAEELLRKESPTEQTNLALAQLYLFKAKQSSDAATLNKALELLNPPSRFTDSSNRAQALLLLSQAFESPAQKEEVLKELTQDAYRNTSHYGEGWYRLGLLALEKGHAQEASKKGLETSRYFTEAAFCFEKAARALETPQPVLAALAIKFRAEALWHLKSDASCNEALRLLNDLVVSKPTLLNSLKDPTEIAYLRGLIALHLGHEGLAEEVLQQSFATYPKGAFADKILFLLATHQALHQRMNEAEALFLKIPRENEKSPLAADALFFAAKCAENGGSGSVNSQIFRKRVYENYPQSRFAAEAYFAMYPYREYVQGDRTAVKHLQAFQDQFAQSPYHMISYYLVGMDFKRDRRTAEGKWIRKKDMNQSIEALQTCETTFDELYAAGKIPPEELGYFVKIRYRAILERALANLAIADDSQGAKRQIFLEYAEEVFHGIAADLQDENHPLASLLVKGETYPALLEENSFWLAQTYIKRDQDSQAKQLLNDMLAKYSAAKITRGYYLSRVRSELGQLALRQRDPKTALENFIFAEDAAKGKILSTDQRIDLWIQQSLCYLELNDSDKAMLLLSKAINSDEVSSLRVKAMYLRADIYAKQGRHELARKQLEATSKKGGEWALKAKQRWEQDYGHL